MQTTPAVSAVSYQGIEWSPVATIPEGGGLPLQFPLDPKRFSAPNGRSGDLLIVQIRGDGHLSKSRKASLASLGLNGVRSSSIRSSFEENIFGYIRAVRDLVAVARLNAVVYRSATMKSSDMAVEFERIEYGTNTRPGGLIRSSLGDYFTFESDRHGLLANWSTDLSADESVRLFRKTFSKSRPLSTENASVVGLVASGLTNGAGSLDVDRVVENFDEDGSIDPSTLVLDLPTSEAIEIIEQQRPALVVARLGFTGLDLVWHREYPRFVDSDLERAEVGIYTRDYSLLPKLGEFARQSGKEGFFDAVPVTAQIRELGIAKHIRI